MPDKEAMPEELDDLDNDPIIKEINLAQSNEFLVESKLIIKLITNDDHSLYTISELKEELTRLDLPTSGNKSKLIERLISYKK